MKCLPLPGNVVRFYTSERDRVLISFGQFPYSCLRERGRERVLLS